MSGPVPRAGLLEIAPYVPGRAKADGVAQPWKLSANENALGCSPAALEAYRAEVGRLSRYPDPRTGRLREAVARRFDLEPGRLLFGCGSDELFTLICQTYLGPGDNMVQPAHGFAAWAIAARAAGASVRSAPEGDLTVDVDALLARVDARTRAVFLADPANPTGTWLPYSEILRLHSALPGDVVLVLDGAYAEFALGLDGFADALELARSARNVLVTRTFSKAYGLAALRVGWGYASGAMVEAMERVRPPCSVTSPAEAAAVAALGDEAFLARSYAHVARWRPELAQRFRRLGLQPVRSGTNFVTVGFRDSPAAADAERRLAADGVLVRGLSGYGLPRFLRVTIGSDAAVARALEALEAFCAG